MTGTLACLFLLASCAADSDPLAETQWRITAVTGVDIAVLPVPPTFEFLEGWISGSAACNGFGGRYTTEGEQLSVIDMVWTERACEGERVEIDETLSEMFARPLRWQVVDGIALSLTNDAGGLLAYPMEATQP